MWVVAYLKMERCYYKDTEFTTHDGRRSFSLCSNALCATP